MTDGIRGMGGVLLGAATWMIANHLGMKGWELWAVTVFVAMGCPMLATGRLKGW